MTNDTCGAGAPQDGRDGHPAAPQLDGSGGEASTPESAFRSHADGLRPARHLISSCRWRAICVDGHHTVEDTGICLGRAIAQAVGDKAGIRRYGSAYVPMDEALVLSVIDLSGRLGV